MIERYSNPEIEKIWSLENKFNTFLKVEFAVCEAYSELGQIPKASLDNIKTKASFSIDRINELEKELKHDVLAFLTNVNETVGEDSKYIHMGLTSSDVIDTALSLQILDSAKIITYDLNEVISTIKEMAVKYKNTICVGRSHGIHAEPMTFGVKLLTWLDFFKRAKIRLERAIEDISIGQISGPVGTYSNISPEIEKITLKKLGLNPCPISTQVIPRDNHAYFMQALNFISTAIEFCSTEIRHLQKTEVLEVEEGFSKGQKGSSAMPHKKNPISSENLCGLSRIVRANTLASMEDIILWHERDISHSSVERIILPDTTTLIDYMLKRFKNVLDNLKINEERMLSNCKLYGGVIFSQKVLLKLVEKGLSREEAYKIVQTNAHKAFGVEGGNFKKELQNDINVTSILTENELENCFDINSYLNNIDTIFSSNI